MFEIYVYQMVQHRETFKNYKTLKLSQHYYVLFYPYNDEKNIIIIKTLSNIL